MCPRRTNAHPGIELRPPFRVVWSRGIGSLIEFPAVISVLQHYGALGKDLPPRLGEFVHRSIRNTRGEIVGEVRPLGDA